MALKLVLLFVLLQMTQARSASNNFAPVVNSSSGSLMGYILEESPPETYVRDQQLLDNVRLIVTDPDYTPGDPEPRYVFSTVPGTAFRVDSDGFIRSVRQPLDFEMSSKYFFTVIVTEDSTVERRSSTLSFTVTVIDVNDHAPVFMQSLYNVVVPEGDYFLNSSSGSRFLANVQAIDVDSGMNGRISYSVSSVFPPRSAMLFDVSPQGLVYMQGFARLGGSFVLLIRASDGGSPPLSNTMHLVGEVVPSGNRPPVIPMSTYTIYVSEGVLLHSRIWSVPATDPDGDNLEYRIVSGNIGDAFNISSGMITNVRMLDREQVPLYALLIIVTDTSFMTATTTVRVEVTDVNDNSPRFVGTFGGRYTFSVQEHHQVGTVIGRVSATDADMPQTNNSRISYLLTYGPNFSVDDKTGAIMALTDLDYEKERQHLLVVTALDAGVEPRRDVAVVIINVIDIMDTVPVTSSVPVFPLSHYSASVPEDAPSNSLVLTLSAIAPANYSGSITYVLAGSTASPLALISTTGRIIVMTELDYETKSEYEFYVTTLDGRNSGVSSATATVNIRVVDVNDNAPTFLGPPERSVTVVDDAPAGLTIATLVAVDRDSADSLNGQVRYSIGSVEPLSGRRLFNVDSRSGRLILNDSLSMDSSDYYTVRVVARDQALYSLSSEVAVRVSVVRTITTRFTITTTTSPWQDDSADGYTSRPPPGESAISAWLRSSQGLLVVVCVAAALVLILLVAVICLCVRLRRAGRRRQHRPPRTDLWSTPASQMIFPTFGGLPNGGNPTGAPHPEGQLLGGQSAEEHVTIPLKPSAPLYPSLPSLQ